MSDPDHQTAVPTADGRHRRRGLGPMFWLVMLFGLACILAGAAIATYGPKWFPIRAPAAPATQPAPAGAAPVAAPPLPARPAPLAAPDGDDAAAGSGELGAIGDRLGRVEGGQQSLSRAAAAALAAAALSEAADTSRPFTDELEALGPVLPASADVQALAVYARAGAPTRAGLGQAWNDVAARAALAARARTEGDGLIDRIARALASVMTIRRIDRLEGKDTDAVLARASRRIDDGDLEGALAELEALPPAARDATAAWRARAQRRLEIDRRIAAIRTAALAELSRTAGPPA